ncbi:hypothetical protein [Paenibacillus sp. 1P07SE]|uniref:hypothetical protein n=1 Tax=Paenibacillus sp. 1P07SE TaxID=3132209 RepID=UPI0039A4C026
MLKKHLVPLITTLVAGIIFGASMTPVFAAIANSNYGYYGPHNGYSYRNQAQVETGTYLLGLTRALTQDNSYAPAGYIGVRARLYKDSQLCYSTNMVYNHVAAQGYNATTQIYSDGCGSGTYHSRGESAAFNGTGYNVYNTFITPNLNHTE